jgi:hypothetical protein
MQMTHQLTTTLNRIRAHGPCHDGWTKLLAGLGKSRADDEPLPFATILRINGLDDALWCARVEPQHSRVWRLFAVWCARQVQHLMRNPRSLAALDVAERHANGMASDAELRAAWAASSKRGSGWAAWAAVWAAVGLEDDAAEDAALAAVWAAGAARAAAEDAAREAQTAEFLRIVGGE